MPTIMPLSGMQIKMIFLNLMSHGLPGKNFMMVNK